MKENSIEWNSSILLMASTILMIVTKKPIVNIIGLIILVFFLLHFIKLLYKCNKKMVNAKDEVYIFLSYILIFLNINMFSKNAFSIAKIFLYSKNSLIGISYLILLSMLIILWIIAILIWLLTLSKERQVLKSTAIIFCAISIILFSSTLFYANIYEDCNKYYTYYELNTQNGLFKTDGQRVDEKIDYLYFSSVIIFTIGYDDVVVYGKDLKFIITTEMFISYLLMCTFVPSIFSITTYKEG